jgi:HEPN domain-containing protein
MVHYIENLFDFKSTQYDSISTEDYDMALIDCTKCAISISDELARCPSCGHSIWELQLILNTYASDVFRRQADLDYIAARSNYKLQLRQQFLWSAQQAIEKYLKAILLFNGISARFLNTNNNKEFNHNLTALVSEIEKISIFTFSLDAELMCFIQYLSQQGPNRYLGTTAYNTRDALKQLDETVWQIRRYCQHFPKSINGATISPRDLQQASVRLALSQIHIAQPQKFKLIGGELEKILKRSKTDPARKALVWANLMYGAKRRTKIVLPTFSSIEIPPRERGWQGVDWNLIDNYIKP